MGLLEQQNFLAKLYTNEDFRQKFIDKPKDFGKKNGLSQNEIDEIEEILPDEISAFADSLFYKRLREVEKFLPLTRRILEDDFENYFREFIKTFNPKTIKKHFEDSLEFAKYLQNQKDLSDLAKDFSKYELGDLEFREKNLIIKRVGADLRKLNKENLSKNQYLDKKTCFIIWFRFKKFRRILFINLPFNI